MTPPRQPAAAGCFPQGTGFVTSQAADAPTRLAEFLSQVPGPITVVRDCTVGEGAYTAAGSTITEDVPPTPRSSPETGRQ